MYVIIITRFHFNIPFNRDTNKDHKKLSQSEKVIPSSADVVIIGGGVAGCSALYHLVKLGIKNVVLVESSAITAGTTWHTAGLVWHLRPSDTEIEILGYSWELMKSLESVTGINTGYIQNGGLFIASTPERLDEYQRLGTVRLNFKSQFYLISIKIFLNNQ